MQCLNLFATACSLFFLYVRNSVWSPEGHDFRRQGMLKKPFKKLTADALLGLKTPQLRFVFLNLIKHCCSFWALLKRKHFWHAAHGQKIVQLLKIISQPKATKSLLCTVIFYSNMGLQSKQISCTIQDKKCK